MLLITTNHQKRFFFIFRVFFLFWCRKFSRWWKCLPCKHIRCCWVAVRRLKASAFGCFISLSWVWLRRWNIFIIWLMVTVWSPMECRWLSSPLSSAAAEWILSKVSERERETKWCKIGDWQNDGEKNHFRSVKLIFSFGGPTFVGVSRTFATKEQAEPCQEAISFLLATFCLFALLFPSSILPPMNWWMSDTGTLIFYMIADWKINEWQISSTRMETRKWEKIVFGWK